MVCSACGFENPKAMRFCGMCGTPLPHPPLTAPGAQSTLTFTRVPMEGDVRRGGSASSTSSARAGGRTETRTPASDAPSATLTEPAPAADAPPAKELVPDVPLDEYLRSFQYRPPKEPDETTMRGDTTAEEQAVAKDKTPQPASEVATTPIDAAPVRSSAEKSPQPSAFAAANAVESRLGLEPKGPSEAASEASAEGAGRPRFLDIAEPAKESEPAISGTSTIVGPSFLGLSDAPPEVETIAFDHEEAPRSSHWRAWLSVAVVVVVLAVLGLLEWRAQAYQTNNGPVQVIKTQISHWKHGILASLLSKPASNAASTPTSQPGSNAASATGSNPATAPTSAPGSNGTPEIEVQQQPQAQPQNQNPPAAANPTANPATNPNPPATSTPAAAGTATTPPANSKPTAQTGAGSTPPQPAANQSAAPTTAANAKGSSSATDASATSKPPSADETPKKATEKRTPARDAAKQQAKPDVPGAEEMAKAANASDSAAEAAWLWKATAKGNSTAPIKLANMYLKGDGVPRSCEQAVVLLKTAATKENAPARSRLASMYATGNCVPRNRVEAYRWLSSALVADPASQWAQQNRDLIWRQMTPQERALAQKYR